MSLHPFTATPYARHGHDLSTDIEVASVEGVLAEPLDRPRYRETRRRSGERHLSRWQVDVGGNDDDQQHDDIQQQTQDNSTGQSGRFGRWSEDAALMAAE